MVRMSAKRLWRCRVYAILVLALTAAALFITWKQLPDQHSYGVGFRSREKLSSHAAGTDYFDIGQPVEKLSVHQVTLVRAEGSYREENETANNNAESITASPPSPAESPPAVSPSLEPSPSASPTPQVVSSPSPSPQVVLSLSPSPPAANLSEAEIAHRNALINSSREALLRLNDCPQCSSDGEDKLSDPRFFEKFGSLETGRQLCLRDIRERIIEDFRPLFANVNRVVLMDVALHTNMGDNVLWRAAVHLASLYGHSINHVCAGSQGAKSLYSTMSQFPYCDMKKIVNLVKDGGLILYHAGGNWGDLYRFVQQYRMKALQVLAYNVQKEGYSFKVAQLPQTIYYTKTDDVAMDVDDYLMHSLPPDFFTLFTRQTDSFEFAEEHYGSNIQKVSTADVAFLLGELAPIGDPEVDILILIRSDGEILAEDKAEKEQVKAFLRSTNASFAFQDWHYRPNFTEFSTANPTILSEVRLNEAVKIMSKGQIVITNRMHGSVVATLIGRTLLWVDTKQKKLAGVRQTAFNFSSHCTDENLRSFEFPTILDAAKAAVEYLDVRPSIESFT